jgi:YHS domain-containing protein
MRKRSVVGFALSLAIALLLGFTVQSAAEDKQCGMPGCPNKAKADIYAVHHGHMINFCHEACHPAFEKDPDATLKKAMSEGRAVTKLKAQSVCPVSGEKLKNKNSYVDAKGMRIYTCCDNCKSAVEKDPKKQVKTLYAKGETPDMICEKCGVVPADHVCTM